MSTSGSEVSCFRMPVTPTTVALKTLVFLVPVALNVSCSRSPAAAPKTPVFSRPVALRSAVHERQQLRSQLLSNASNSDDSGSEDTGLLKASSSEISCS